MNKNPCIPSPCGLNSVCRQNGDNVLCTCTEKFIGSPPNCHPECIGNSECPNNKACINMKCTDPCTDICGRNAQCYVVSHTPICQCNDGYTGDPFLRCEIKIVAYEEYVNPCIPSPCGPNAVCKERNSAGACYCLQDFFGNPYEGCRPECILNSDCPSNKACIQSRCQDPCPGSCGANTECYTINHMPNCVCPSGYDGNPYQYCSLRPKPRKITCLLDFYS